MNLHELAPNPGSTKTRKRVGRGTGQATERRQAAATRDSGPVRAAESAPDLREARCLLQGDCPSADLSIYLPSIILPSMSVNLKSLKTEVLWMPKPSAPKVWSEKSGMASKSSATESSPRS